MSAAIVGTSIVLTLMISQLAPAPARRDAMGEDDRSLSARESRARLRGAVSRVPRDVISIFVIVLLGILVFVTVSRVLFHSGATSTARSGLRGTDSATAATLARALKIPKLPDSAFALLPRDFSINHPPWCRACRRPDPPRRTE
ncbi:MAG: hypothetical protein ABSG76_24670 [Xanthobacteraceae bacterium]